MVCVDGGSAASLFRGDNPRRGLALEAYDRRPNRRCVTERRLTAFNQHLLPGRETGRRYLVVDDPGDPEHGEPHELHDAAARATG